MVKVLNYLYYKNTFKGSLSEDDFSSLASAIYDLVQQICEAYIPSWEYRDSLEEYGLNLDKAMCYQIDFINELGGLKAMNGASDADITSVKTEEFTYAINQNIKRFNGIPISPIAKNAIMKELRIHGYLKRGLR